MSLWRPTSILHVLHPHPCFLTSTFTPRIPGKLGSFTSNTTRRSPSSLRSWRCSSSFPNMSHYRGNWKNTGSDRFRERRSHHPGSNSATGFREREDAFEPRERRDEYVERRFERHQRHREGRFDRDERRGSFSQRFRRERYDRPTRWNEGPRERRGGNEKSGPLSIVQKALAAEDDQLLYGINPVYLALLSGKRERFEMLFVQDRKEEHGESTRKTKNEAAWKSIMDLANEKNIPIEKISKGDLNSLCKNRPHQGVVLQASPLEFMEMTYLPPVTDESVNERGRPFCYLVLDQVYDPQNAGALLRSAHFLGADGVIVCQKNSCPLSEVVSKASAGAVELTDVWGVKSMPRFLRKANEDGWRVIGTDLSEQSVGLREVSLDKPTLLVLGSEGHGLRTLVKKQCNVMVRIGGSRNGVAGNLGLAEEPVDSLNVSVAGAVALFQLLGK